MKMIWLTYLMPLMGMFFAAGADALAGAGGNDSGAADLGGLGDGAAGDETGGLGDFGADVDDGAIDDGTGAEKKPVIQADQEEPEAAEFRVPVGRRMVGLVNKYPALKEAFAKHPELQKELEPVFRREAALRECFPTVAEARQMREALPNGLADLATLQESVQELRALDTDFYTRDQEGNYPGHQKIVENMWKDDAGAAEALFRTMPKLWARNHPESYNDVMGRIVGATIAQTRVFTDLDRAVKSGDAKRVEEAIGDVFAWANGWTADKPAQTEEEKRLARDKQNFQKEKGESAKADGTRFHSSFTAASRTLQNGIIKAHPAVTKLLANKTIPDAKKAEIIESVRESIEGLLAKSPSFMNKLNPAYSSRNLRETLNLQKTAWSQGWLLNRMVRQVFSKEIPQLVQQNRGAVQRRAGAPPDNKPRNSGVEKKGVQPPKQINGRWYRNGGDGEPFTTAEVLAGKHLQA